MPISSSSMWLATTVCSGDTLDEDDFIDYPAPGRSSVRSASGSVRTGRRHVKVVMSREEVTEQIRLFRYGPRPRHSPPVEGTSGLNL